MADNKMVISPAASIAIVEASDAFSNGCAWAVMPVKRFNEIKDILKKESGHFLPSIVTDGVVLEMDKQYLYASMCEVIKSEPSLLAQADTLLKNWFDLSSRVERDDISRFRKLIEGKKGFDKKGGFLLKTIAIYSVNDSGRLVSEGVTFPAFRLPLEAVARGMRFLSLDGKRTLSGEELLARREYWKDFIRRPDGSNGVLLTLIMEK